MDQIVRMIARDMPLKAMAITGTALVERARSIHETTAVATAALGRSLMAASMIGHTLKEENASVTLRINGGGPLGNLLAVSDNEGNVRGYVQHPQVELPSKYPGKLDVGAAVGKEGALTLIKDLNLKEPYVGTVPLVTGEIADDIIAYFAESEQTPTACGLGVLVGRDYSVEVAGGFLIQLLPGADDALIDRLEQCLKKVDSVTAMLQEAGTAQALLERVLDGFALEHLETSPVEYRCYCSRERMKAALVSLGRDELLEIIRAQGNAEMSCQFCDSIQRFEQEELKGLLAAL